MLQGRGYCCFEISLRRHRLRRNRLALRPVAALTDLPGQSDVLWLPPGNDYGFEQFVIA
jgi:hypothetical protein